MGGHRRRRGQRGLRVRRPAVPAGHRAGGSRRRREPQRRRHLPGPPSRRDGCAHDRDARLRAGAARRALRARDDVHRLRAGDRGRRGASPSVTWWADRYGDERMLVAYLSMEFGLDERLPIYAGGLGVLAGDHLKSASDLGVPTVAVGLFYRRGYFRQAIEDGRQVERYQDADPTALGLEREATESEAELPARARG